eukprot:6173104-Pleurochrysis_carterae.AAC.2
MESSSDIVRWWPAGGLHPAKPIASMAWTVRKGPWIADAPWEALHVPVGASRHLVACVGPASARAVPGHIETVLQIRNAEHIVLIIIISEAS